MKNLTLNLLKTYEFKLSNGLYVILNGKFNSNIKLCYINFLIKCGLYTENESENGITHLIEHLLFKGTQKYTNFQLNEKINQIEATINAYTSSDTLGIELSGPISNIEQMLDILSQLVLYPTFPINEIENEKQVIIEEIRLYKDDPEDLIATYLEKKCYNNSCYGREILGKIKNIKNITRNQIINYHKKYFIPSNSLITIVGSFNELYVEKLVIKYFDDHNSNNHYLEIKNKNLNFLNLKNTRKHYKLISNKFKNNYFGIGFLIPSSNENNSIYSLLLPYFFSNIKSTPINYALKEELKIITSFSTDIILKYGMWLFQMIISYHPSKSFIIKKYIYNYIRNISRFVNKTLFHAVKNMFLIDCVQELENPSTYCNEISIFNYILGKNSYYKAINRLLDTSYESYIKYLQNEVENCLFKSVELISKTVDNQKKYISLSSLLRSFNKIQNGIQNNNQSFKINLISNTSNKNNEKINIDVISDSLVICSCIDKNINYSTLTFWLKGGILTSLNYGDVNLFVEMFGNTKKHSIKESIIYNDYYGIILEINYSFDCIKLEATTYDQWQDKQLEFLSTLFFDFYFNQKLFLKAKSSVKNIIKSIYDDVIEFTFWKFVSYFVKNTCYDKILFSNEDKILKLSQTDIINYYNQLINTPYIVISYSTSKTNKLKLNKFFNKFFNLNSQNLSNAQTNIGNTFNETIYTNQHQCIITIGSIAPSYSDKMYIPFLLASNILSDYAGNRLWNLREKYGLCYNIFCEYLPLLYTGIFFCYAATSSSNVQKVKDLMLKETLDFAKFGPLPFELESAKKQLIRKIENQNAFLASKAKFLGNNIFYKNNKNFSLQDYLNKISKITCEDVKNAFSYFFKLNNISTLIILQDKNEINKF